MKTRYFIIKHLKRTIATCLGVMCLMQAAPTLAGSSNSGGFNAHQPIKLVVPFPPGGGADILARITAAAVGDSFGQPLVVINKPGAEGAIGSEYVSRSDADGYTLLMASADTHSIYPHVYTKAKFPAAEFVGVAPVATMGYVLVGRPGLEAKTLDELVALSKNRQLSYSSWGVGNSSNLAMVAFSRVIDGKPFLHVPYQGAGPAAMAVIGGQVDIMMMPLPIAAAQGEKIQTYGVLSEKRSSQLPQVPTLREQGMNLVSDAWIGIIGPPKLPANIAAQLSHVFNKALTSPESVKAIEDTGMAPLSLDSEAFAKYLKQESEKWGELVKSADIHLD